MDTTIYEPVEFQYIRPNGVFYLDDPRKHNHDTLPHYACEDIPADQIVWTVYFSWQGRNPWILPECFVKVPGNKAANLINDRQSDWF